MKVLMFGWEFPPHISGGLGTACFGLTKALAEADTEIIFVIPRTESETETDHLELVNASKIPISTEEIKATPSVRQYSNLVTVGVTSAIKPYTSPDVFVHQENLKTWSYQFAGNKNAKGCYPFSGTYNHNLMEEVVRFAAAAVEIAGQQQFDIIHAHDWPTFAAGIAVKKLTGKPLVLHVHATEYDRAGEQGDAQIYDIERTGMECADRIIAVSRLTKDMITSKYQIDPDKVIVVHNGIISKKKNHVIQRPPIGKKIVTFLGRITFQKGPEYFVDAAVRVLQKFPDVHFVMAGSGDQLPPIMERAARLRISSHIHFTGFLKSDQVDRIWSITNVYVMPSVSEPFGITPLEAAQAGVPIIISNQSGVSEVLRHAIKVDFWNVEELANAICNLLKYQSLSNMLRSYSTEEINQVTWKQAAKKVNTLYHALTK
jgi:glycogen(starch) synthase